MIHGLEILRSAGKDQLRDPAFLESVIVECGLYPRGKDELAEFPAHLWPACKQGLGIWQYPNQLSRYLIAVSQSGIKSYLEVGVAAGGTLIFTCEYLRRFQPEVEAYGIDPSPAGSLLEDYLHTNPAVHFIQDYSDNLSRDPFFQRKSFDLVFIDGGHSAEQARRDFNAVRDKAGIIALHDIGSDLFPGLRKVWEKIRRCYEKDGQFAEFTDQYPEVQARTKRRYLGIGMFIKKRNDLSALPSLDLCDVLAIGFHYLRKPKKELYTWERTKEPYGDPQ